MISVIIPVFCDQAGLDQCLDALREQSFPSSQFEVIVVDNASKPALRLLPEHAAFARIVVCQRPGAYAARNTGLREASGDIFAFTDADCHPEPQWIRKGVAALEAEGFGKLIGGEVLMEMSVRPTAVERYQYLVGFQQRENIEVLGFSATANLFATRTQVKAIGSFMESLLSAGDREWCWRARSVGFSVKYAREAVVRTSPRTSLRSAIRQARRVTGGRFALERMALPHIRNLGLLPHRSAMAAAKWIVMHPQLTPSLRFRVLVVAVTIKAAQLIETFRLKAGAHAERR